MHACRGEGIAVNEQNIERPAHSKAPSVNESHTSNLGSKIPWRPRKASIIPNVDHR